MTDQQPQAWCDRDALLKFFEQYHVPRHAVELADALLASGIISRKPSEGEAVRAIKALLVEREVVMAEKSTIDDLERILNAEETVPICIGSVVEVFPVTTTIGIVARAVLSAKGEGI